MNTEWARKLGAGFKPHTEVILKLVDKRCVHMDRPRYVTLAESLIVKKKA